jgi:hypothetical protein
MKSSKVEAKDCFTEIALGKIFMRFWLSLQKQRCIAVNALPRAFQTQTTVKPVYNKLGYNLLGYN